MARDPLILIRQLLQPRFRNRAEYFAVELDVNDRGKIVWGAQTRWTGFTPGSPRYEIRKASVVIPHRMWDLWYGIGEPCLTINTLAEFKLYLMWGGNALLRREIAEQQLADVLKPYPVVQRAGILGWVGVDKLTDLERQHAPPPKTRMKVINRDQKRCMICGRRPADDVHVQLEVHHIRTWATGGVTEIDNLITLCSTCHVALEPHNDHTLYDLIGVNQFRTQTHGQEHYRYRLKRYQEFVTKVLRKHSKRLRTSISGSSPSARRRTTAKPKLPTDI